MTLRLGIIGAGAMGARVASAAHANPAIQVAAVFDPLQERARSLAAEFEASTFAGLDELVGSETLDAVYIGVPHDKHLEAYLAVARGGLHALIDKPMCNTREEADEMARAASTAGAELVIGFSYRFRSEWMIARELIAAGRIGTPRFVVDTLLESSTTTPDWYWDKQAGGGVIQLQSHHCFDRLAWVLDDSFADITCRTTSLDGFAEDAAVINATTASGAVVSIDMGFGRRYEGTPRATTIIQGDHGQIIIDGTRVLSLDSGTTGFEQSDHSQDDWLYRQVAVFADRCVGGNVAVPGVSAGARALECALAAAESAESHGRLMSVGHGEPIG